MSQYLTVYSRTSSDEQKKNQTIEAHLDRIPADLARLRLLEEHGGQFKLFSRSVNPKETDPAKVYFLDDGFNLEKFPFPEDTAIHELLTLIQAGQVHAVYVDTPDRLLRSSKPTPRAYIQEIFDDHDVRLFTHNGETTIGLVMEIVAAISADDKKKIGRRLHSSKKTKTKLYNAPSGGPPFFGFQWLKDKSEWSLVEDEIKWIRWAGKLMRGKTLPDMPESLRAVTMLILTERRTR